MLGRELLGFGSGSLGILIVVESRLESLELVGRSHRHRLLIETWHPVPHFFSEAFLGFGDLGCGCAALDFDAPDLRDLDCVDPGFVAPCYAAHGSGVGCVASTDYAGAGPGCGPLAGSGCAAGWSDSGVGEAMCHPPKPATREAPPGYCGA